MPNHTQSNENVKRHFLPAASIAYFSSDETTMPKRKRKVWVLPKDGAASFEARAEKVGYQKNLYGRDKRFDFDDYLSSGEKFAHQTVDTIRATGTDEWVDADAWVELAWYVTTLFARGPDLENELAELVKSKGWDAHNVTVGYPLNTQRISAAVIRARWEFLYSPKSEFVLPDRGIIGFYNPVWKTNGYIIPVRKDFVISLGPAPYEKKIRWVHDKWLINIDNSTATPDYVETINQVAWHASREQLYASNQSLLNHVNSSASTVPKDIRQIAQRYEAATMLGLSSAERRKDELLLMSLRTGIKKPDSNEQGICLKV